MIINARTVGRGGYRVVSLVPKKETLIDSYSESNADAIAGTTADRLHDGANVGFGQSFTGKILRLSSCQFYLGKVGSPTGEAVAKLYLGVDDSGYIPTGSALAVSNVLDVSQLSTTRQLTTFVFPIPYLMAETVYCITVEYSGGGASDYVVIGIDTADPSHSGNLSYNNGGWSGDTGIDTCFYVFGQ